MRARDEGDTAPVTLGIALDGAARVELDIRKPSRLEKITSGQIRSETNSFPQAENGKKGRKRFAAKTLRCTGIQKR